ncbi:MAG: hypothetical protein LBJ11_11315, partial [Oscillospiraceae bacterium]|nr:hypothetical protein [Oscillospiraceae bacterium]
TPAALRKTSKSPLNPPKPSFASPIFAPCCVGHRVEYRFLLLKRWRGIATRYAKTTDSFLAAVQIRCIAIWAQKKLKLV